MNAEPDSPHLAFSWGTAMDEEDAAGIGDLLSAAAGRLGNHIRS